MESSFLGRNKVILKDNDILTGGRLIVARNMFEDLMTKNRSSQK